MIERAVTTLRILDALPAIVPGDPATQRLLGDCADALRLELDCPQQVLTPMQGEVVARLVDLLDSGRAGAAEIADAVRDACRVLGVRAPEAAADHDS